MKKTVLAILCTALVCLLCACSTAAVQQTEPEAVQTPAPTPEATRPPDADGGYARFPLVRMEETYGSGSALIYPAVDSAEYASINTAIYKKIVAGIGTLDKAVYTYFNIMCNQNGILSLVVNVYDMQTSELYLKIPMTFDAATGRELALEELFDPAQEGWRSVIPDEVTRQAAGRALTLLSDIMPVCDGQLYYLTSRSVVIMYRPYEISTYSAGWPEFSVSYEKLEKYMDGGSAAMRLISGEAEGDA